MTQGEGRFEYTTEGFLDAKKYLKKVGKWKYVSTHGFSVDGWSIISEANSIYKQNEQ